LELEVPLGEPLPSSGALGEDLTVWLARFMSEGRDEADVELHAGQRRFRIRARRLGTSAGRGGAVVALEDVTDELRTERVLAWGEMARQVAHEVKNPLTPIKLSVQHVQRAWEDQRPDFGSILTRNADAMLREIDRLAEIAQSFSRFGAPAGYGEAALTSVDVAGVVEEVLTLYRASEGPVRFVGAVSPSLQPVRARVPEMKEVLVNLLENARAASAQGAVVEVEASPADDGGVVLAVIDHGVGISEAFMPRVFEPHFSTRSTGTGLGLAIVRRLVESWGGEIQLASREGEGTRVTVNLRPWGAGLDT
jgi:nitrogen fixation/metabolism regulation signal transduction histidine kinase